MRTSPSPQSDSSSAAEFPRAATVRISALATAFLTGGAAISLLVAPAASAAVVPSSVSASVTQSVSSTWGHDGKHDWKTPKKTEKKTHGHSWNWSGKPADTSTIVIAWHMPASVNGEVTWPQQYVGIMPDCGTGWYQVDTYRYGTKAEKKLVDHIISDGILEGPHEDGKAYIKHVMLTPANDPAICNPTPPVVEPPVEEPPVVEPPVEEPPVVEPPVEEPPVVEPPVTDPPVVEPPVEEPPVVEPPVTDPPVVEPPVEEPPVVEPPVETPPVVTPSTQVAGAYGEAPAPAAAPQPSAAGSSTATLPVTGSSVALLLGSAAALVAGGLAAIKVSRRRAGSDQ